MQLPNVKSFLTVSSPTFSVPQHWKHVQSPPLPSSALWRVSHALPLPLHLIVSGLYILAQVLRTLVSLLFAAPLHCVSWSATTALFHAALRATMETLAPQARHSVGLVRMACSFSIPAWLVRARVIKSSVLLDSVASKSIWTKLRVAILTESHSECPHLGRHNLRNEIPSEWVMNNAVQPVPSESATITLFLHGGAHIFMHPGTHRTLTSELSKATRGPVFALDYSLAPDAIFPAAIHECIMAYLALLGHTGHLRAPHSSSSLHGIFTDTAFPTRSFRPDQIHVMGDSSGGALVLQLLLALKALELPMPASAVCMSPFADIECKGETFRHNWHKDFMALDSAGMRWAMTGYTGPATSPAHPVVSPVNWRDFAGFPRVLIQVGDAEVLLDDSLRLFANMSTSATRGVELQVYRDMFHVFQVFAFLEEAKVAVDQIGEFVLQGEKEVDVFSKLSNRGLFTTTRR